MSNIKHSSESAEHGTPPYIVEPARALLGGFNLDPATDAFFNKKVVKADKYFNIRNNGLSKSWFGSVFLNPPGGLCDEDGRVVYNKTKTRESCRVTGACGLAPGHAHVGVTSSAKKWWFKLAEEYLSGRVGDAFFVGFSLEIVQTTQAENSSLPTPIDFPCCYPAKRIPFVVREGKLLVPQPQPTHANVLTYLPGMWNATERKKFHKLFEPVGKCVWPSQKVRR